MPRQTSVQLTESTERQAAALKAAGFGNMTDIIRTAIDRMYQQERRTMNTKQIQERIETLTVRMDAAARKSSADPVIQRRLDEEIDAAWAEIRELEAGSDEEIFDIEGTLVFVNEYLVGVVGGHPSNVDYYYSEQGYGCTSAAEVAAAYYHNVVKQLKEATK